ncbi:MAG: rod shape-determining protein MreD [Rickettsiales bacterium]|nr:rod shape-determining protein MreD [Rickettsiales bacterium]
MQSSSDYFRSMLLRSAPSLLLLIAVIMAAMPMPLIQVNLPFVFFTWMVIYYWSLYAANTVPYIVLFLLGLVHDIVAGWPLGLDALMFMVWRFTVAGSRRFIAMQQFWTIWAGFALMSLISVLMYWLLLWGLFDHGMNMLFELLLSAVLTSILYPICHILCNLLYARMPILQLRPQ